MLYSGRFVEISSQTSSIAHVGLGRLKAVEISLPPMESQKRKIEHIAALEAQATATRTREQELSAVF